MTINKKFKKLFREPTVFFKDALKNKANRVNERNKENLMLTISNLIVMVGFSEWKKDFYKTVFHSNNLEYIKSQEINKLKLLIAKNKNVKVIVWSYSESDKMAVFLAKVNITPSRMEDGFIRSFGLGAQHNLPLSYVLDSSGALYFESKVESGLEKLCNKVSLTNEDNALSKKLISTIKESKLTKYNSVTEDSLKFDLKNNSVLCIGQVEGDMSLTYGSPVIKTNYGLVKAVKEKFPEVSIYFRPHPDTIKGGRKGGEELNRISEIAEVLDISTPLTELLDKFDSIHTITSLVGFEALLRGQKVYTYGQPFYSSWGLTEDFFPLERRRRKLSIEELFYCTYVIYPQYVNKRGKKATLESTLEQLNREKVDGNKVLDRIQEERSGQVSKKVAWAFRFGPKVVRESVAKMFPEYDIKFANITSTDNKLPAHVKNDILKSLEEYGAVDFLIWGYLAPEGTVRFANRIGANVFRVEDSFIRSVGLGGELDFSGQNLLPISIVKDSQSIYYNYNEVSDIELIIKDYSVSPSQKEFAKNCIGRVVDSEITKYNSTVQSGFVYPVNSKNKVLVLGQVEQDASIKYGTDKKLSLNDLVRIAKAENPDSEIFYKPHPAVLSGSKINKSNPIDVADICTVLGAEVSFIESLKGIDRVYVISSGSGFEALIRGIPVTCFGANFYAGWGVTDDRIEISRRGKQKTVEELFYCFYVLYTRYFDHDTQSLININEAIDIICKTRKKEQGIEFFRQAKKALKADNLIVAMELYEKTLEFQSNYQIVKEVAELCVKLEQYDKAFKYYNTCKDIYAHDNEMNLDRLTVQSFFLNEEQASSEELFDLMLLAPDLINNVKTVRILLNNYLVNGEGGLYILKMYTEKIKRKPKLATMDKILSEKISLRGIESNEENKDNRRLSGQL